MKTFLSYLFLILFSNSSLMAGVVVAGSLVRTKSINPGESHQGIISLQNTDETPVEARVYITDYLFYSDGSNLFGEPGSHTRSNADWITIGSSYLTIPGGETKAVYYTVEVPDNDDLLGTYWSIIMIEPSSAPAMVTEDKPNEITIGMQTVVRFGVQIVTEINDTGTRDLSILEKRILSTEGERHIQLDVGNSGELLLIPAIWMELYSKQGESIGRFDGGRFRIYPGCSVRSSIDISNVPKGEYLALVIIDNGDDYVVGAQYKLEI